MKTSSPAPSLTEQEFDRLSTLLHEAGPDSMNIEMLDGFFAKYDPCCMPTIESLNEHKISCLHGFSG